MGHSRVICSEAMCSDLIKASCLASEEELALEILESMEMWYNIKPTAISYEPIIHYFGAIKGARDVAQDILMMMLNSGVELSPKIVDSLVLSHLSHGGDSVEALDCVQELFN